MNVRLHERIPADIEIQVTNVSHRELSGPGWILDASKSGLALLLRNVFFEGDIVQVNFDDSQFYGHVVYVHEENGLFRTGVEVEQVLLGRSDLGRLVEALSSEAAPTHAPAE